MSTRGKTIKYESPQAQTLLRPMITRRFELVANHETCCGCGTCAKICPREAITMSEPVLVAGRLEAKPRVDIDPAKCSFCGECVALCPTHSLAMTVNGQEEVPVQKAEAFPYLIRRVAIDQAVLAATRDVAYIDNCPRGAISADVARSAAGEVTAVQNVAIDRGKCVNCTHCMEEGPQGGFTITKPYRGRAALDVALCPAGCQACVDVCPSRALTYDGARVHLDERFCLYCEACVAVCPAEGAVRITRTGFLHTPVESGAWRTALEKLVSVQEVVREFDVKGQTKRRNAVLKRLLREMVPEASGDGRE